MVRDFHLHQPRDEEQILEKRVAAHRRHRMRAADRMPSALSTNYSYRNLRLIAVEAGGRLTALRQHAARFSGGVPGVLQGTFSYVLQDENGQIAETHSVSAGLDYASIGPEHAALHDSGRAEYVSQDDAATLDAVVKLARTEGILPALESAHAIAECLRIAPSFSPRDILIVNLSGRGDKDMGIIARELKIQGA
jgi:tryptophan synthase beta chain